MAKGCPPLLYSIDIDVLTGSISPKERTCFVTVACKGGGANGAGAPNIQGRRGIKKVKLQKLHFIKLLKIFDFSYPNSTNTFCMDLIGSCLGGMV